LLLLLFLPDAAMLPAQATWAAYNNKTSFHDEF
jgi:hypothetical protein